MKICPTCRKTYNDDGLNFCLDDGSVLTLAADKLPETVMMNQPRFTDPSPSNQQGVQSSFGNQGQYSMQPAKKSSKAWIWVLGILGVLVLVCGGGFAAFFVYVASLDTNTNTNGSSSPTPRGSTPTPSPFPRNEVKNIDLETWVNPNSAFGNTSYAGGEFFMSSKKKGFYYVVAAPAEYKTGSANSSVTLRNVDAADTTLGYGIVFHSNPTPLQKGYAFVIDTQKGKYRVVRHEPKKEIDVVNWTSSSSILSGSAENKLEVRDTPDRVELYINGDMVTTIKNTYGYPNGVVGLYSGDAVNVAYKNLEIIK